MIFCVCIWNLINGEVKNTNKSHLQVCWIHFCDSSLSCVCVEIPVLLPFSLDKCLLHIWEVTVLLHCFHWWKSQAFVKDCPIVAVCFLSTKPWLDTCSSIYSNFFPRWAHSLCNDTYFSQWFMIRKLTW